MLNQLESLTEHVEGSNKLVDRWLHVRKHLLVAYYNLVGIKPGKESYMRLNEKALDDFLSGPGRLPFRRTLQYL
ncbi:anti-RNA polymerase sigma 70 factor [Citrobacter koseri]|uniref:Anti-RNA polymerase sigma 70 factor n=1 Tax=Citrobacter koseri TaxID=545 RepID=A0A2X2W5G7_CITKO|nr:anti-RNA polymerase sigma 70 factor [Citrobacter koseri]